MNKFLIIAILICCSCLSAISSQEIRFLLDKEQFELLSKNFDSIAALLEGTPEDIKLVLEYAERAGNPDLALRCHYKLAMQAHSLESAIQWCRLREETELDSLAQQSIIREFQNEFSSAEDKIILDFTLYDTPEDEYLEQIRHLRGYNSIIEELAKGWIDDISVQPVDSLALPLIERFETYFPLSKWAPLAYYYRLFHLSRSGNYIQMAELMASKGNRSDAYRYITTLYLMSPAYRKALGSADNMNTLNHALEILGDISVDKQMTGTILIIYDEYQLSDWVNRLALTKVKLEYYQILAELGLYGDEENIYGLLKQPTTSLNALIGSIDKVSFLNNDRGDWAELAHWKGKIHGLCKQKKYLQNSAERFIQSSVYGAPRKKYDIANMVALKAIQLTLKNKQDLMSWIRYCVKYSGIAFEETDFPAERFTRIAIGDYNNDGYHDLLFNGNALFRNEQGKRFTAVGDTANTSGLNSNGGLWADFNKDGLLDFATISHSNTGTGEALMKNMDGQRFVKVNERTGDIDDGFPTEGAAWVDVNNNGMPSLYCANYERWQERSGYPDFFWLNEQGYFSDASELLGFRDPVYTDNPGLAGRGVAPADYDNDGQQEILVTNYRLNRNLCWDQVADGFVEVAAADGMSGKYKEGYFGHSIGADWGDYDNDGDLDLFIANLAHPRYIQISDISQLMRNDGLSQRVVGADTLFYWQFTDVTKEAGITFDELHSDPLWFDADNDGFLDLFITSVYENDRSYLYRNNGNGTFTDITFLSNCRIYNGWGNATADLNRDGLTDLVVGSGNGAKVLMNKSKTKNKAIYIKPVWDKIDVVLLPDWKKYAQYPNTPAFGTRVKIIVTGPGKKRTTLTRELSSAKGTTSQSSQELSFGLGRGKCVSIERVVYETDSH